MALCHKMSDRWALGKICCGSLNITLQGCDIRQHPAAQSFSYWKTIDVGYHFIIVSACKLHTTISIRHKMSSIFGLCCVQGSIEPDRLKSKAASAINAHCRPLERSLKTFMTLMNASSNRSNQNWSAKAIKETKNCHNFSTFPLRAHGIFRWASTCEFHLL